MEWFSLFLFVENILRGEQFPKIGILLLIKKHLFVKKNYESDKVD